MCLKYRFSWEDMAWLGDIYRSTMPASPQSRLGPGRGMGTPEVGGVGPEGSRFTSCVTTSQPWNAGRSTCFSQPVSQLPLSDSWQPRYSLQKTKLHKT